MSHCNTKLEVTFVLHKHTLPDVAPLTNLLDYSFITLLSIFVHHLVYGLSTTIGERVVRRKRIYFTFLGG